jgi:acetyltransferase-like isoleucine patch superfamily enzyme
MWKKPKLKHKTLTEWFWTVWHPDKLTLGEGVDIGCFTYINAEAGVNIGDDVQIGSHCSIYSVSTIDDKFGPVNIGQKARIGTHSTVMPGVTIGENALIAAHSFVNQDVPAWATAYGVPVRIKK